VVRVSISRRIRSTQRRKSRRFTGEHLPCRLRPSGLHVSEPSLNPLDGLDALRKLLVGFRILDDDLGFPVDRQDQVALSWKFTKVALKTMMVL
jgi:hypothetical protein